MLKNYHLISNIIKRLSAEIKAKKLQSIYTQNKNEIVFDCGEFSLLCHLDLALPYLVLSQNYHRREQSLDLLSYLKGERLKSIELINNKRIIALQSENYQIFMNLFYGKVGLSVYQNDELIDSIKEDVVSLEREEISSEAHTTGLIKKEAEKREVTCERLLKDIENSNSLYWYQKGASVHFTALQFESLSDFELVDSKSPLLEAYENFIFRYQSRRKFTELYEKIEGVLRKKERYFDKTRRNIRSNLEDRKKQERYESYGHLILSHIHQIKKRDKMLIATNWFNEKQEDIEIPLKEKLSAQENAERYYRKAKSIRQNENEMRVRLDYIEAKQKIIHELKDKLSKSKRLKDLEKIKKSLISLAYLKAESNKEKRLMERKVLDAMEFKIDGYDLLVGKNAKSNDFISLKAAKANDYWFHVQGSPGSHVLLRWHQEKDNPPKDLIKKVASLTAYYSKQKNAGTIPVVYTLAKYVRKPRGAKAGAVTIQYEKSVFVQPKKIEELQ